MRLKSLKLAGFKSFANPTTFSFKHDITAIVGPNGCGKSNVIDAIRWVLGETSAKQLRGGAMSDVIFAGVEGRAAKSLASVELTFEHTQDEATGIRHALNLYHELTLRRQVSKDGKSDYFINGQRVRRRDVVDVFLGTGLGSRSYAIIEQGMIGRIVDSSPAELRAFIEEAAGVSRYQVRRDETERQLTTAKDNLARLDDLQGELKKQQKTLERQAESARRYQTLQQEIHAIDGKLLVHQLHALHTELRGHRTGFDAAKMALASANERLATERSHFEQLSTKLNELNWLRDDAKDKEHALHLAKNSAEHALAHNASEQSRLIQEIDSHAGDQHALITRIETLAQDIARFTQEAAAIKPKHQRLTDQLTHDKLALDAKAQTYEDAKRLLSQAYQKDNELNNQLSINRSTQKRLVGELERWQARHQAHRQSEQMPADFDALSDELEQTKRALAKTVGQLEHLTIKKDELSPQLLQLEHTATDRRGVLDALEREYTALMARYHTIHALVYPTKPHSIQPDKQVPTLHTKNPDPPANLPSIKDCITLTELGKRVTPLIDAYVASYLSDQLIDVRRWQDTLNTLITRNMPSKDTDTLPSGLWANQTDKVTLTDDSTLPDGLIPLAKCLSSPQITLWQDVLVQVDPSVDVAEFLSRTHTRTPEIKVITHSGWLVGLHGARNLLTDHNSHYLGERQAHLDTLAQLENELDDLESRLDTAKSALTAVTGELSLTKVAHDELVIKLNALTQAELDQQKALANLQTRLESLNLKRQSHADRTAELDAQKAEIDAELASLQQEHAHLHTEHTTHQKTLNDAKRHTASLADEHAKMSQTYQNLARDLQELVMSDKLTQERLAHLGAQHTDAQHTLAKLGTGHDDKLTLLSKLETAEPTLKQTFNQAATAYHEATIQLEEYSSQLQAVQRDQLASQAALTTAHQAIAEHQGTVSRLEANIQALNLRLDEVADSLRAHHAAEMPHKHTDNGDTINVASLLHDFEQADFVPDSNRQELNERKQKLVAQKERLGAVNLAAAAELDELMQRISPMDAQIRDVEASIKSLQDAIVTIDGKTRGLFLDMLNAVNDELGKLFAKVFGGGQASLTLIDDATLTKADKWRAGLVLMAQPKGKKNSRLAVLSGGEKTLTALSLIFAIFKQHPAPFCVLDEVDAPLDDANVARFTSLISELANAVQFIFISHNKLAMQSAHELKGVTMPTAGISTLVSVDLAEAQSYISQAPTLH